MKHKCEVISSEREYGNCNKEARFKIVDYECGYECGGHYLEPFWVCDDCIEHFIKKNEDNPHYILLEVLTCSLV